jgi:hypothetical protein
MMPPVEALLSRARFHLKPYSAAAAGPSCWTTNSRRSTGLRVNREGGTEAANQRWLQCEAV